MNQKLSLSSGSHKQPLICITIEKRRQQVVLEYESLYTLAKELFTVYDAMCLCHVITASMCVFIASLVGDHSSWLLLQVFSLPPLTA